MKTFNTFVIAFFLNILFSNSIFLNAQERIPAPIKIIDFDGGGDFYEVEFAGPESRNWIKPRVDFRTILNNSDTNFILQGNASRKIEWNLQTGQYGAWGMDIRRGENGYDASQANALQFGVIGVNGVERFKIEIKDVRGTKQAVPSIKYFRVTKAWGTVTVPLSDFNNIDPNQLATIALVFDKTNSGQNGAIYVDDFTFTQKGKNIAPEKLIDFDGVANCTTFPLSGPDSIKSLINPVDYEISYNVSNQKFIQQGGTSRYLRWNLDMNQWCGWAVVVGDAARPFDASQVKSLTFWVAGAKGNEIFDIEIKNVTGQKKVYSSIGFIKKIDTTWRKVCIPFDKSLATAVKTLQLEAIALVFKGSDCAQGAIYVDDFQFEFANCE